MWSRALIQVNILYLEKKEKRKKENTKEGIPNQLFPWNNKNWQVKREIVNVIRP